MKAYIYKFFHFICVKNYNMSADSEESYFAENFVKDKKFFDRFEGKINIKQKNVIDIGCGFGNTCIYIAQNGSKKAVGIDINKYAINFAKRKLSNDYKCLSNIVRFRLAEKMGNEKFDIVLSKNSFEHYADPESFIYIMKQYMKKRGAMVIGISPLWKSPYGGHIRFMTKFPWAHLIFPERVIMEERKNYIHDNAESFEQISGGLNKMTLSRFMKIIRESDLKIEYIKINASYKKLIGLCNILRLIPFCREFFEINVYTILRNKI